MSVPPSFTFDRLEQAGRLGPSVPTSTGRTANGSPLTAGALSCAAGGLEQAAKENSAVAAIVIMDFDAKWRGLRAIRVVNVIARI